MIFFHLQRCVALETQQTVGDDDSQKTAKPKSDVKNSNLACLKETITYFLHILQH
jgi:hypothetical protein